MTVRALVEMSVKRAMRENADCTVLLLDRSKMGVRNYYQVFALAEIDILITDGPFLRRSGRSVRRRVWT